MTRIFLILCFFFALLTAANAGELYRCIDRDGSEIISDYPRDGMKCVLGGSYRDPSPQERAKEQREADAYRQQNKAAVAKQRNANAPHASPINSSVNFVCFLSTKTAIRPTRMKKNDNRKIFRPIV